MLEDGHYTPHPSTYTLISSHYLQVSTILLFLRVSTPDFSLSLFPTLLRFTDLLRLRTLLIFHLPSTSEVSTEPYETRRCCFMGSDPLKYYLSLHNRVPRPFRLYFHGRRPLPEERRIIVPSSAVYHVPGFFLSLVPPRLIKDTIVIVWVRTLLP